MNTRFNKILSEKTNEWFPQKKPTTRFYKSITKNNPVGIFLTEQDAPAEPAPATPPPATPAPGAEQEGTPGTEEVKLENIPYNLLGWYAYKALMTDPADISSSPFFDQLQELTGGGEKSSIDSPEKGVRVFQTIQKIIEGTSTPVNAELPAATD
jgi:hypothetical protein